MIFVAINGITKSLLQTDKWGKDNKSSSKELRAQHEVEVYKKQNEMIKKGFRGWVERNHHPSQRVVNGFVRVI